jgi:potassium-dependent mechanosensitive channel
MQLLKLIMIFFLFPTLASAHVLEDTVSLSTLVSEGGGKFANAWRYHLFSLDDQSITVSSVVISIVFLVLGFKLARYLSSKLKKKLFRWIKLDKNSTNLVSRVVDYSFVTIMVIVVLEIAGVPITIFTFIGGAFVVSIGLSSQHLLNNFISGISLIIENKINIGDLIEFEGKIGRVENIEARAVHITMLNNLEVVIPHSKLMQEKFTHWTANSSRVRMATEFKIDQKDSANNNFEEILLDAVMHNRDVLSMPRPQVLLLSFEHNMLVYEVNFWVNLATSDRRVALSDVNNSILNTLRVHNISLVTPSLNFEKGNILKRSS